LFSKVLIQRRWVKSGFEIAAAIETDEFVWPHQGAPLFFFFLPKQKHRQDDQYANRQTGMAEQKKEKNDE